MHLHPGNHAGYYPGAEVIHLALVFSPDGTLLGAQAVGGSGVDKRIDVLATALRAGMTVDDLAELELAYAPPFGSAKDPVNMAGFLAQNVLDGLLTTWSAADLDRVLDGSVLLLDVRSRAEFEVGHLPGALNVPHTELRDAARRGRRCRGRSAGARAVRQRLPFLPRPPRPARRGSRFGQSRRRPHDPARRSPRRADRDGLGPRAGPGVVMGTDTIPLEPVMQMDEESAAAVATRLRRARGQIEGVLAMIEAGRDCEDIVTQLSAASKAVDRAAFTIVSCGLTACIEAEHRGEEPPMDRNRLEKLFLSLA